MTLTPPPGVTGTPQAALNLTAADPVTEVVDEEAAQLKLPPISSERQLAIGQQAKTYTHDLLQFNPNSQEFKDKVRDLARLAKQTMDETAHAPNRMLERGQSSLAGANRAGGDASQEAAKNLTKLRGLVEELTPNRAALAGPAKILGFIPGGNKLRRYFNRYQSAQVQLNVIINSLLKSQDELGMDNATLQQEQVDLWQHMGTLKEYGLLAKKLDEELAAQVPVLRAASRTEDGEAVTQALYLVRQRRVDILTQLAVAVQGYLAMDVIRQNNEELIRGVDRARLVTVNALRTAILIAGAVDNQRLVLDQIDALRGTTEKTILQNGQMLRKQNARIQEQAAAPAISLDVLSKTFEDLAATLDSISTFKDRANTSMEKTIDALHTQMDRYAPVLEKARALDTSIKPKPSVKGINSSEL